MPDPAWTLAAEHVNGREQLWHRHRDGLYFHVTYHAPRDGSDKPTRVTSTVGLAYVAHLRGLAQWTFREGQ